MAERFPTTYWQRLEFIPSAMIDGAWIAELIKATADGLSRRELSSDNKLSGVASGNETTRTHC